VNGKESSIPKQDAPSNFFADAYKHLEINYPKFHKMDSLSKLGLIATEAALKGSDFLQRNSPENVAIILTNKASSLDTDKTYQNSINSKDHYLPSPATFVYTLPNIVIGEIAIKHKITGENAFFVCDAFDSQLLVNQAQISLNQEGTKAAICGWVDYDNGVSDALIYLVEIASDSIKNINFNPLNGTILNQFYK
jgi:3-oxoacyl-(acyl-carrier-protein) synthase